MGKGKRNSLQREQDRVNNSDKLLERQQKETKKSKTDKGVAIACIVFAVLIAATLVFTVLGESGVFIRATDAVAGETVEVDAAMMSFFINDSIMNFYNNNYSYLAYYSLDLSRDLRTQTYGKGYETMFLGEFDGTWYDYFLSTVMDEVEMYVTYAEAAKAAGLTLTDEDKEEIDQILDDIKETLKASNASYSDWYGKGVKKSDIRNCYELIFLASNFAEHKQAELEAALDADDSALHTYVDENKGSFYTADYLSYEISLTSKNFKNDEMFDTACQAAKAAAEKIAAAKTPAEFVALVEEFEGVDEKETGTGTEKETLSPEEELESKIEDLKDTISYETGNELGDWIFVEGAQPNDVKVIEETGTETEKATEAKTEETTEAGSEAESETESGEADTATKTYNTYTVTVYYVTKASSIDKSLTKDFAYLATNDKEALEAVIAEFKAGEMTKEKFNEIAQAKYDSIHNNEEHEHSDDELFEFNAVEKTPDGMFNSNYKVMNEWLDSGKLENNSLSEIFEVVVEEKTYYAVVFFEKYNVEAWYASAYSMTVSDQFEKWYEAELESKPLKINEKAIYDINTVTFTATTTSDGHDH